MDWETFVDEVLWRLKQDAKRAGQYARMTPVFSYLQVKSIAYRAYMAGKEEEQQKHGTFPE